MRIFTQRKNKTTNYLKKQIMKKSALLLFAGLALFSVSCKKDKKDDSQTPEQVAENKTKMEQMGVDFVSQLRSISDTKAGTALQSLTSLGNTKSALVLDSKLPVAQLLAALISQNPSTASALKALKAEDAADFKAEIEKIAATYTWNSTENKWDSTAAPAANTFLAKFPAVENGTANNAEFKLYDMAFTTTPTSNSMYSVNNAITSCKAYLKVDGVDAMTYNLAISYDSKGIPTSVSTSLAVDVFSFNYDMSYSASKMKSDLSIKHNSDILMAQGFDFEGELTEAKAKELETYYNDETTDHEQSSKVGEFVKAAIVYYQVMDIKIIGSVDVATITKDIDALGKESTAKQTADVINKNCSLYGIFASSGTKIANVEIYPKASEDGQDEDPGFNLLFPDGSKADLQTYVEDPNNFANFKSDMEKFADDMAPSKDEEPVYVD